MLAACSHLTKEDGCDGGGGFGDGCWRLRVAGFMTTRATMWSNNLIGASWDVRVGHASKTVIGSHDSYSNVDLMREIDGWTVDKIAKP